MIYKWPHWLWLVSNRPDSGRCSLILLLNLFIEPFIWISNVPETLRKLDLIAGSQFPGLGWVKKWRNGHGIYFEPNLHKNYYIRVGRNRFYKLKQILIKQLNKISQSQLVEEGDCHFATNCGFPKSYIYLYPENIIN